MTAIRSYSLSVLRGLTSAEVSRLKKAGIDNTAELLAAARTTHQERALASRTGITQTRMREAVNRADLVRVGGIGPATADLFENAGVNSAKELSRRNPAALAAALEKYLGKNPELNYRLPSPTTISTLVARAKEVVDAAGPGAPTATVVAKHLKSAVVRWYVKHQRDLPPGSPTGYEAQMAVTPAGVREVTDPEDDPHGHDLAKYQVFSHPDVIFPGSDMRWYAVFERGTGKFVETYNFN